MPTIGGIVLCGGRSSRMGRPKLSLPVGDEVMLQRVVRILSEAATPICVVAAPGQPLPRLPPEILAVRDEEEGLGPLAGIAAGLETLTGLVDAAYVSACDAPLLRSEFIRAIAERLGEHDLAIPRDDRFHHPLAAVYRTSLAPRIRALLAAGQRRPLSLVEASRSNVINVEELRAVDPQLDSLRNTNTPEEYSAALRDLGL
jgi:molybdopterin-guanine dinucleotide biosynthesis protein A